MTQENVHVWLNKLFDIKVSNLDYKTLIIKTPQKAFGCNHIFKKGQIVDFWIVVSWWQMLVFIKFDMIEGVGLKEISFLNRLVCTLISM